MKRILVVVLAVFVVLLLCVGTLGQRNPWHPLPPDYLKDVLRFDGYWMWTGLHFPGVYVALVHYFR
jgi:hypothetical protein